MKKLLIFLATFYFVENGRTQNVGIGTSLPDYRLHVANSASQVLKLENLQSLNAGISTDIFLKTGLRYTGAIKTIGTSVNASRLGLFTFASPDSTELVERLSILDNGLVGIGTAAPSANLHISPNSSIAALRIDQGANGNGLICYVNSTSNARIVFSAGSLKTGLTVLGDGNVGIGVVDPNVTLRVSGDEYVTAIFENTATEESNTAIEGRTTTEGYGIGVAGRGGTTGVAGYANFIGNNEHYGVDGYAGSGSENYGVYGSAAYGTVAYGVYGFAQQATTNWAGYFQGNVYATGTYQGSDRKLKNDIKPLSGAMEIINKLQPSAYTFKANEFSQMQLPEGLQYGLVADELKQVMPGLVKKAIQPASYENNDGKKGKKISEAVEFDAVNYTALIPILIGAVKEQQSLITSQQQKIDALIKETAALKMMIQK